MEPAPVCQPRALHECELVISTRAHLPTWLPRTQRSRLVPAAILESRMPTGMQRAWTNSIILGHLPPQTNPQKGKPPLKSTKKEKGRGRRRMKKQAHQGNVGQEHFPISRLLSTDDPPSHLRSRRVFLSSDRWHSSRHQSPLHRAVSSDLANRFSLVLSTIQSPAPT